MSGSEVESLLWEHDGDLIVDASHSDVQPVDRFGLVYGIFVLFGAGMLWPFNAIISVPDFFNKTYPSEHLEYILPTAMNLPNLLMLVLMAKRGHNVSFSARILLCFSLSAFVLSILPLITQHHTLSVVTSLSLLIVSVFLLGIIVAVLQSAIFGLAGMLPTVYTQAVMLGNGISGLGVTVIRMVTKTAFCDTEQGLHFSASLHFLLSAFISIVCMAFYLVFMRLSFTRHHLRLQSKSMRPVDKFCVDADVAIASEHSGILSVCPESSFGLDQTVSSPFDHSLSQAKPVARISNTAILMKVWRTGLVVYCVFLVTLLIFPGFISDIKSTMGIPPSWFSLILIAEFNAFDTVGRSLPRWFVLFGHDRLWIPCAIRMSLYPAFVLARLGIFAPGDVWIFFLVGVLALSNGYLSSLGMMAGPASVERDEKEAAAYVMTCFLMFGIVSGLVLASAISVMGIF